MRPSDADGRQLECCWADMCSQPHTWPAHTRHACLLPVQGELPHWHGILRQLHLSPAQLHKLVQLHREYLAMLRPALAQRRAALRRLWEVSGLERHGGTISAGAGGKGWRPLTTPSQAPLLCNGRQSVLHCSPRPRLPWTSKHSWPVTTRQVQPTRAGLGVAVPRPSTAFQALHSKWPWVQVQDRPNDGTLEGMAAQALAVTECNTALVNSVQTQNAATGFLAQGQFAILQPLSLLADCVLTVRFYIWLYVPPRGFPSRLPGNHCKCQMPHIRLSVVGWAGDQAPVCRSTDCARLTAYAELFNLVDFPLQLVKMVLLSYPYYPQVGANPCQVHSLRAGNKSTMFGCRP